MSQQFYVSPEQVMKDRADYARKGIGRNRSVVVLAYDGPCTLIGEQTCRTFNSSLPSDRGRRRCPECYISALSTSSTTFSVLLIIFTYVYRLRVTLSKPLSLSQVRRFCAALWLGLALFAVSSPEYRNSSGLTHTPESSSQDVSDFTTPENEAEAREFLGDSLSAGFVFVLRIPESRQASHWTDSRSPVSLR